MNTYQYYYDRSGKPISPERFAVLHRYKSNYIRVAEDTIGNLWISTVWLGINHEFRENLPPLIFETRIFKAEGKDRYVYQMRYSDEQEAFAGHLIAVQYAKELLKRDDEKLE